MDLHETFVLNKVDVLFECFDDEIVAINLKNGYYYSINLPGIPIWELLMEKVSPDRIIKFYQRVFPEATGSVEQSINKFIFELVSENLILNSGKKDANNLISEDLIKKVKGGVPFSPDFPVLEKYTDQQELLLLDPIHEVSELGWPEKRSEGDEND